MKQFTEKQRYELNAYLQIGKSKDEIATLLGFHRSTIYREICRNSGKQGESYSAYSAQRYYENRKYLRQRPIKFTVEMEYYARFLLTKRHYSPEQIAGRCKQSHIPMLSHESLYQWIWEDKKKAGDLYTYLRRQGRKNRKRKNKNRDRGWIKDRVDISQRPTIVEKKERFGDLEIDTVIGKNKSGVILTINDRATGKLWTMKLPTKEAKYVTAATIYLLEPYKELLHTITSDNGSEFAGHKEIAKELGIKFYFARPYHSWERGANENLNGLIRQYLPKCKEFKYLNGKRLQEITNLINLRPRKRYGYLNPFEMAKKKISKKYKAQIIWMMQEVSRL